MIGLGHGLLWTIWLLSLELLMYWMCWMFIFGSTRGNVKRSFLLVVRYDGEAA